MKSSKDGKADIFKEGVVRPSDSSKSGFAVDSNEGQTAHIGNDGYDVPYNKTGTNSKGENVSKGDNVFDGKDIYWKERR